MAIRILIADDEPDICQLLELVLSGEGYDVLVARNGDQAVRMAQEHLPDLVLVDLMMPYIDGFEAIRQLRNDTRTAHLPMLILTAKANPGDVVTGFDSGADDYITKPFNTAELLARIRRNLHRAAQRPVLNPLTGLKGNELLAEELKYRLRRNELFALLYIDLDNFKAFNDTYGPARGDRVIKLLAQVVLEAAQKNGNENDFVGHIGGDDFALITTPEKIVPLCQEIIASFDARIGALYDEADRKRGYLMGIDRHGITRTFPLIGVSIGVASTVNRRFADYEEIARCATEMKQFAKQTPTSSYQIDNRSTRREAVPGERRGARLPIVLLISADNALCSLLRAKLESSGYRVREAADLPGANLLLTREPAPNILVLDQRIEQPDTFEEFLDTLQASRPTPALLLISIRDEALPASITLPTQAVIRLPFLVDDFVSMIGTLIQHTGGGDHGGA